MKYSSSGYQERRYRVVFDGFLAIFGVFGSAVSLRQGLSDKLLEIANALQPDLITLDLMMPGLTGFELCKLLHDDPKFAKTPIVIVSAKDDAESKEQAKHAGATDYLTKPFGLDEFLNKINLFIKNRYTWHGHKLRFSIRLMRGAKAACSVLGSPAG